jgi:hypothetical protein
MYIAAVSFIGGGNCSNRRKPPTCRKSLTNFITTLSRGTSEEDLYQAAAPEKKIC